RYVDVREARHRQLAPTALTSSHGGGHGSPISRQRRMIAITASRTSGSDVFGGNHGSHLPAQNTSTYPRQNLAGHASSPRYGSGSSTTLRCRRISLISHAPSSPLAAAPPPRGTGPGRPHRRPPAPASRPRLARS